MRPNVYACYFHEPSWITWLIRLRDYLRYACRVPWGLIPSHAGIGARAMGDWIRYFEEIITGAHVTDLPNREALAAMPGLIRIVSLRANPDDLARLRRWMVQNEHDRYDLVAIADDALNLPIPDRRWGSYDCSRGQLVALIVAGFRFRPMRCAESPLDAMIITLSLAGRPTPIRNWPFFGKLAIT